jgi:ribosome biogenesis GTPase
MWALPPEDLAACFPEFRQAATQCRFADCHHIAEPDCEVRAQVESGAIDRVRYDSYLKLRSELED